MKRANLILTLLLVMMSYFSFAQIGIKGIVNDTEGNPLPGVNIIVKGTDNGSSTDADGTFSITAPNKNSTLIFSFIGFETIEYSLNNKTDLMIEMTSTSMNLNQVVVSASRKKEKVLDAPAAIEVISAKEIQNNISLTSTDHLYSASGVDVSKTGLTSSNVATRGFNNVFSGSVLTMVDNRVASVPSLRVNSTQMIPGNSDDISSIEVLKGPASAIYGPFSANGVIHILTKSPLDLDEPETKVSFSAGERDLISTSVRTAGKINDNLGYKVSVNYLRATDWDRDSADLAQEIAVWGEDGHVLLSRQGPNGTVMTGDSVPVIKENQIDNWNVDARIDYKVSDNTKLILSAGRSNTNGIELTGLGAGEARDWSYSYWQARLIHKDLFIQAYGNESDAGESFMRRSGNLIVDNSQFISYQIQHSTDIGKLSLTYGVDAYLTRPKTDGTINGNNEFDDNIDEKGVYLQGKYAFNDKIDLIGAVRYDNHSFVEETQMSPRAALIYKFNPRSSMRFSYNQAYESPSALNYSLDILSGYILPEGGPNIAVLGIGNRNGFTFNRDENGAVNSFYSPFLPVGELPLNDINSTNIAWNIYLAGLKDNLVAGVQAQYAAQGVTPEMYDMLGIDISQDIDNLFSAVFINPGYALIGLENSLMALNLDANATSPFTPISMDAIKDVNPLVNSISTTKEVGYKGFIGDKLTATVDVYETNIKDFVGPLTVMNPNVFIDPTSAFMALTNPMNVNVDLANSQLGLLDAVEMGGNGNGSPLDEMAAGLAQIPYGTVMPNEYSGSDILMTYANFGDVTVKGVDLAATYYLNDNTEISGSYSWVDKNEFETEEGIIVPLNAPAEKFSFSIAKKLFENFDMKLRYRWQDAFPVNSGVYVGEVSDFAVADLSLGYNIFNNSRIDLNIQNITDNVHNEFIGAPQMGRLTMLRFSHAF